MPEAAGACDQLLKVGWSTLAGQLLKGVYQVSYTAMLCVTHAPHAQLPSKFVPSVLYQLSGACQEGDCKSHTVTILRMTAIKSSVK